MPDEDTIKLDTCGYCGQIVMMMCRKNTGYCSEQCKEDDE